MVPSLQAGGMERVMSELASYFSLLPQLEIHLVLYGISPVLFYSIPSSIIIHKPDFVFNNKYRAWFTLKTLLFLRRKVKSTGSEYILSFGEYWNNLVLIALFGLKLRIFVSDRCQPDKSLGTLHGILRKIIYPTADGVIVQTKMAYEIYRKKIPDVMLRVIGNPIRKIDADYLVAKENIVLSVGRMINTKHFDELIRLFVRINAPGWKLVIVGGDALKQSNFEKYQDLINTLGVGDSVFLTGYQKDIDIFYRRSRIFAFTSSSEGFPNVIGEAMSAGLPVVAFDCIAGPSELITDQENGFLIPVNDYGLFQKRLEKLMHDEQLRAKFGERAQESVLSFSISEIGRKYYEFIISE